MPILLIWVIGAPAIALYLLYKNIKKGAQNKINQYLLILYQGLKKDKFYWEFVNTLRKIVLLFILVFSDSVKIFISSVMLYGTARLQMSLQPYKERDNNSIEILAILSCLSFLLSSLVYLEADSNDFLNSISTAFVIVINFMFLFKWTHTMIK
jgi:hypothetical protein